MAAAYARFAPDVLRTVAVLLESGGSDASDASDATLAPARKLLVDTLGVTAAAAPDALRALARNASGALIDATARVLASASGSPVAHASRLNMARLSTAPRNIAVHAGGGNNNGNNASTACPICLDPLGATQVTLACFHAFHAGCIKGWEARHATCPVCRADIAPGPTVVPGPTVAPRPSVVPRPAVAPPAPQPSTVVFAVDAAARHMAVAEAAAADARRTASMAPTATTNGRGVAALLLAACATVAAAVPRLRSGGMPNASQSLMLLAAVVLVMLVSNSVPVPADNATTREMHSAEAAAERAARRYRNARRSDR